MDGATGGEAAASPPKRVCEVCGGPLQRNAKYGVCRRNRECSRERYRRWLDANREVAQQSSANWKRNNLEQRRKYLRQRMYGLTPDEHTRLFAEQGGKCAICRQADATHVDHDHKTGAVRGLLCHKCNAGLGLFDDDLARLRSALAYLEAHADAR